MNKKLLVVCFLSFFAIYSLLIVFSFDVGELGELIGFYLFRFLGVGAYLLPFFWAIWLMRFTIFSPLVSLELRAG